MQATIERVDNSVPRLAQAVRDGEAHPFALLLMWHAVYLFRDGESVVGEAHRLRLAPVWGAYAQATADIPFHELDKDDPLYQEYPRGGAHTGRLVREYNVSSDPLRETVDREEDPRVEVLRRVCMDVRRLLPGVALYLPGEHGLAPAARDVAEILMALVESGVAYHQGLHELVGAVYLHVQGDYGAEVGEGPWRLLLRDTYASEHLNAHVWAMARQMLAGVDNSIVHAFYTPHGFGATVEQFDARLRAVDWTTARVLEVAGIDSRVWLVRWLRLLMLRDVPPDPELVGVRTVWDRVVSCAVLVDDRLEVCPFVALVPEMVAVVLMRFKVEWLVQYSLPETSDSLLAVLLHFDRFLELRVEDAGLFWTLVVEHALQMWFAETQGTAALLPQVGHAISQQMLQGPAAAVVEREWQFYLQQQEAGDRREQVRARLWDKLRLETRLKFRVLRRMQQPGSTGT